MVMFERIDQHSAFVYGRTRRHVSSPAEEAAINKPRRFANAPFLWSTRVLPAPRRQAMQAFYAFLREIRDVVDGEGSWTMKLALLADWRAEIAALYAGRPEHIVTRALDDAVERFDLLCQDFLAVINGEEMDAREIRAPSLEYLDLYCEQRAVAVSRIALRILGATWPDSQRLAAALGRGIQLTGILRDLTQDAARHRVYLPRELLHAHRIFATMPAYVLAQRALPQVCNALAERAAAHFADAERAIVTRPKRAMLAANAMLSGYRALLEALVARGWSRLDEPVRLPARRQAALLVGRDLIGR
jgi:phytoene synthase